MAKAKKRTQNKPVKKRKAVKGGRKSKKGKKSKLLNFFSKFFWFTLKPLLLIIFCASCYVGYQYYLINQEVEDYIKSGFDSLEGNILSAPVKFPPQERFPLGLATQILELHGFKQRLHAVKTAGDYSVNNNTLSVFLKSFMQSSGKQFPSKIVKLRIQNNYIFKNKQDQTDYLAPVIISGINSRSKRTKSFYKLDKFPLKLRQAVIAVEDNRFYDHIGIDFIGILRAMIINIKAGHYKQGGSTITQQLAKNVLLSREKSLKRKFKEALAAISFEQNLSKNRILELYLNEIYLGQSGATGVHGFYEAARFFFSKSPSQLDHSEIALLAALIKAPSYYAPHRYPERALERRNLVLEIMFDDNLLTRPELNFAKESRIKINQNSNYKLKAPYFIQEFKKELAEDYNLLKLDQDGVEIQTGLDLYLQQCSESAVSRGLAELDERYKKKKKLSAGLVAIESFSGLIRAWAGGRDFGKNQFDHVNQAKRQLGSIVKPFVYLTALDKDLNSYKVATPITILSDQPITVPLHEEKTWSPKNYDRNFRGAVTLRYALEKSLNIPTVYVSQKITPHVVARTIEKFKIVDHLTPNPSIALGAVETNLLRITSAYGALANGGIHIEPRFYVALQKDNQLNYSPINEQKVSAAGPTYLITNILQGVVKRGTGRSLQNYHLISSTAGKTGTTNSTRDAWFVGYTPEISVGVWVGYDDNSSHGLTGSQGALPIWARFMKCAEKYISKTNFYKPADVLELEIDSKSGLLYHPSCGGTPVTELFVKGTEPEFYCHENFRQYQRRTQSRPPEDINLNQDDDADQPKKENKSLFDVLFG